MISSTVRMHTAACRYKLIFVEVLWPSKSLQRAQLSCVFGGLRNLQTASGACEV